MVTQPLLKVRSGLTRARTHQVCRACGEPYTTRPGEQRLAAVFCVACLESSDEPVTDEHAWDLGGGD